MADNNKVFGFEIDGIEETIENFESLEQTVNKLEASFEEIDSTVTDAAGALDSFNSDKLKEATEDTVVLEESIQAVVDALKEGVNPLGDFAEELDKGLEQTEDALEGLEETIVSTDSALEELTAADKAGALGELTQGLTDGLNSAAGGLKLFGANEEQIAKVTGRVEELNGILQGAVSLTTALRKENITAAKSLISGFAASAKAARAFVFSTRGAIAATGIGALIIALGVIITNFDKIKKVAKSAAETIGGFLAELFPPLTGVVNRVKEVAEQIGGFKQLFAGALESAKVFFTSLGSSFVALLKGDFARIKQIFGEFGKESTEAFNKGVEDKNKEILEETALARVGNEIKINERIIAERTAVGEDTFLLEKRNLQRQLLLAKEGSEERLDLESEVRQLILARSKELADKEAELAVAKAEEQKELNEQELERLKEQEEQKQEILDRAAEATVERERLLTEAQINELQEREEQTREVINEAASLRRALIATERELALEDETLLNEERLLIDAEFNLAQEDIERERLASLAEIEQEETDRIKKVTEERTAIDKKAKNEELARAKAVQAAEAQIEGEKLQLAKASVKLVGELAKEGSQLQKAAFAIDKGFTIAEILINLQKELSGIAASNSGLGPAAPAVVAALQIAAGIRAGIGVATVVGTSIKAAKGGRLIGPSHSTGGIKGTGSFSNIEVEGGEFIVNKKSTKKFLPVLNRINRSFQNGGELPNFAGLNNSFEPVNEFNSLLLERIDNINSAPVVVSVEEINTVQDRVVDIEEAATI
jgi:hypothetical protein